jgi:hypothetical protein
MTDLRTPGATRSSRLSFLIRGLNSVQFGVVLLALILVYASVGSALPQIRGALELTEADVFKHWCFATLVVLFSVSLLVATCTRLRWRLVNAGALSAHVGLLLVIGGAFWHFRAKIEGDVPLFSPCIELSTRDGQAVPGGQLPVEQGQRWSGPLLELGGAVHVEVTDVRDGDSKPVSGASVRVQLGEAPAETIVLSSDEQPAATVGDQLQVALHVSPPADCFYEAEIPALYYRRVTDPEDQRRSVAIHGLPIHRERYLGKEHVYHDTAGREVPSKRTTPAIRLAGLSIPTGWIEHWRLPIELAAPDLPFDVRVTGYLPYVAGTEPAVQPGGEAENPAIELGLVAGGESVRQWLLAWDPARALLNAEVPFEFRWVRSERERADLLKPLAGPHELLVEVRDPPVRRTLAVTEGETYAIDGTPYELTVKRLMPAWPLLTPGFEGAISPVASVEVNNGERRFRRIVIQRFPQLNQDIDAEDTRHREPLDSNLTLRYRTSASGWVIITAGPDLEPVAAVFETDGSVRLVPLTVGKSASLSIPGWNVVLTLHALVSNARLVPEPVITPLEVRRPNVAPRGMSAICLEVTGRRPHAGWSERRWALLSPYPHVEARPIHVQPPGQEAAWELIYSRLGRNLGAQLMPGKLKVTYFPGRQSIKSWRSEFFVQDEPGGTPRPTAVYTNHTEPVGRWTLFQSGAAEDHWSYTILGVGNRNGVWPMIVGSVLITVGCLFAFYVKPVLQRRSRGPIS